MYGPQERDAMRCVQPFAIAEEAAEYGVEWATTPAEEYKINKLARLSKLSNIDKHRRLTLVAWYVDLVYWTGPKPTSWRPAQYPDAGLEDGSLLGHQVCKERPCYRAYPPPVAARAHRRRSARRDAHDGLSAVRADQGDRRSVGNARSSSRIEGVERPAYFVRGLACSLVVLGQAMFWCVGTFQDSRPIPRSLLRRTGASARRIRLPAWRPGWRRAGLPVSEPAGASGYWSVGEPT